MHKKSKQRMFLCIFQDDTPERLEDLWVGKPHFCRVEDSIFTSIDSVFLQFVTTYIKIFKENPY